MLVSSRPAQRPIARADHEPRNVGHGSRGSMFAGNPFGIDQHQGTGSDGNRHPDMQDYSQDSLASTAGRVVGTAPRAEDGGSTTVASATVPRVAVPRWRAARARNEATRTKVR